MAQKSEKLAMTGSRSLEPGGADPAGPTKPARSGRRASGAGSRAATRTRRPGSRDGTSGRAKGKGTSRKGAAGAATGPAPATPASPPDPAAVAALAPLENLKAPHLYLIGSADCMKRNLESRVEILVPIEDAPLAAELRSILDRQLTDLRLGWEMHPDGSYVRRDLPADDDTPGSQEFFMERARRRSQRASKYVRKIAKARLKQAR